MMGGGGQEFSIVQNGLVNAHILSRGFLLNLCFIDLCLMMCALFHRCHAADRATDGADGHSQGRNSSLDKTE